MILARKHRDRILASQMASAPVMEGGLSTPALESGTPAERAAASVAMRLQHDLRRLKEIQSIERRIDVKREMLPEYADWVAGLVAGGRDAGHGAAEDVLPTIMVWRIDVGDYDGALELADHVMRYDVALPARYNRTAPALIAEEIADAAIKAQTGRLPFRLDVIEHVAQLTADADMHDQIRAKLQKALGSELARRAEEIDQTTPAFVIAAVEALAPLRRAVALHDRVGVAGVIKRLEKAITTSSKPTPAEPTNTNTAGAAG